MDLFDLLFIIFPALFPILFIFALISMNKRSRRNVVDWKKIRREMTAWMENHGEQTEGPEIFPCAEDLPEDAEGARETAAGGQTAYRFEAAEGDFPHEAGEQTAFFQAQGTEPAFEEEGMGSHTMQGEEALHGLRPAWVDTSAAAKVELSDRNRLREAIVFSEIIGPPAAKRRRRAV